MKSISISQPVWDAIASRGKFGETEDDVLRRVFGLSARADASPAIARTGTPTTPITRTQSRRSSYATNKLSSYISGNELRISFASGQSKSWKLPPKTDKAKLRAVRDEATAFAEKNGATLGQVNAVKKTLTDSGYHLLK
jgi:negative regulator of replication initiation